MLFQSIVFVFFVFLQTQPEAITGSSRMKGGSATKILLELILWAGLMQSTGSQSQTTEGSLVLLKVYQRVLASVRQHSHVCAECIELTGKRWVGYRS